MNEYEAKLQRLRQAVRSAAQASKEGQDTHARYVKGDILDWVNPYAEGTEENLAFDEGLESAAKQFSETHTYDFDQ